MAGQVWVRSEDDTYIKFDRADGLAGYRVHKHPSHLHAEQWMPWSEAEGNSPVGKDIPTTPADVAAWFEAMIVASGDTLG